MIRFSHRQQSSPLKVPIKRTQSTPQPTPQHSPEETEIIQTPDDVPEIKITKANSTPKTRGRPKKAPIPTALNISISAVDIEAGQQSEITQHDMNSLEG